MIAHVADVPVEELLLLVLASGAGGLAAGRRLADAAPATPTGARDMTFDKTLRIEPSVQAPAEAVFDA